MEAGLQGALLVRDSECCFVSETYTGDMSTFPGTLYIQEDYRETSLKVLLIQYVHSKIHRAAREGQQPDKITLFWQLSSSVQRLMEAVPSFTV